MNAGLSSNPPTNEDVALALEAVAKLLETQGANPFRVRAYHLAAQTVRSLASPLADLIQAEGRAGLLRLPGIGKSLAHSIEHLVRTGHCLQLDRLRGDQTAERIFMSVADIGPKLARRIHETLGIESLVELESALYDGRLAKVPGFGQKRLRAVREALAARLQRRSATASPSRLPSAPDPDVPVAELLELDGQYRRLASQDRLPRIAPRQFNPTGQAWLPVLHTVRGERHYTALYSNTARAHELGVTHDWVVIYRDDDQHSGSWTIITATFGKLRGHRIVRGREDECQRYYESQPAEETPVDSAASETATKPASRSPQPQAPKPKPQPPKPEPPLPLFPDFDT
jgi:hypothetical protein